MAAMFTVEHVLVMIKNFSSLYTVQLIRCQINRHWNTAFVTTPGGAWKRPEIQHTVEQRVQLIQNKDTVKQVKLH